MSFVRPRELFSFDPWDVMHSPPIGRLFELGGITITFAMLQSESLFEHCLFNIILF